MAAQTGAQDTGDLNSAPLDPCPGSEDGTESEEESAENKKLGAASTRFSYKLPQQAIYKGMLFNEVVTQEGLTAMANLQFQPNDVIVCGFPKSGTTWIEHIVHLILVGDERNKICSQEKKLQVPLVWLDELAEHKKWESRQSPRLAKTHATVSLFPPSALSSKLILAIRNPKDVAVSYFYFHQTCPDFGNFQVEFSEFVEMFELGYVHWGSWMRHVRDWWVDAKTRPNSLPVFYEETKENPHQAVQNLAKFLEVELAEEDVNLIVQTTSFAKMKERNKGHFPYLRRKGEVGDWKNHFSREESQLFDDWLKENIQDKELLDRLKFEL